MSIFKILKGRTKSSTSIYNKKELDIFKDLKSPHQLIIGSVGSGKTYYIKNKIKNNNRRNFVLTTKGSDYSFYNKIDISKYIINPNENKDKMKTSLLINLFLNEFHLNKFELELFRTFFNDIAFNSENIKKYDKYYFINNNCFNLLKNLIYNLQSFYSNIDDNKNNQDILDLFTENNTIISFENIEAYKIPFYLCVYLNIIQENYPNSCIFLDDVLVMDNEYFLEYLKNCLYLSRRNSIAFYITTKNTKMIQELKENCVSYAIFNLYNQKDLHEILDILYLELYEKEIYDKINKDKSCFILTDGIIIESKDFFN